MEVVHVCNIFGKINLLHVLEGFHVFCRGKTSVESLSISQGQIHNLASVHDRLWTVDRSQRHGLQDCEN